MILFIILITFEGEYCVPASRKNAHDQHHHQFNQIQKQYLLPIPLNIFHFVDDIIILGKFPTILNKQENT